MCFKKIFVALLSVIPLQSLADVNVHINNVKYHFANNPRLEDVLKPIALNKSWYWPASKLYRLDEGQQSEQKLHLLSFISKLITNEPTLTPRLSELRKETRNWSILSHVDIPIDYELSRLQSRNNPRFEDGDYKLILNERPQFILFYGAVNETIVPYVDATVMNEYMKKIDIPSWANSNHPIVLSPNGYQKNLSTYYSKLHFEPMPGSLVFLPFKENSKKNIKQLNKLLLQLSRHRVL